MKWKVFAIVLVVCFMGMLTSRARDTFDLIGLPIELIGVAGVLAYAFHLRITRTQLWATFGWLFAGWSVVVIGVGAARGMIQGLPLHAIAFAMAFAAAWLYPTWLALRRLARAQYA